MNKSMDVFQDRELAMDELAIVAGSAGMGTGMTTSSSSSPSHSVSSPGTMSGGINLGLLNLYSCDVCGPGIGVLVTGSSGVGPFVWAFNNLNTNSGANNINHNNFLTVFN
jgi:hypothetical protein